MKNILVFLSFAILAFINTKASPRLIFYMTDGATKEVDILEIENICFANNQGLVSLNFWSNNKIIKSYISQYIDKIKFEIPSDKDTLVSIYMFSQIVDKYKISAIDSITVITHNTINGRTYNQAQLSFSGISLDLFTSTTETWSGGSYSKTDTSNHTKSLGSYLFTNDYFKKDVLMRFLDCSECSSIPKDISLTYCKDYKESRQDNSYFYNKCQIIYAMIYINQGNNTIDSLKFVYNYKYGESPIQGTRVTNDRSDEILTLYQLPYLTDINNDIIVDFEFSDLSKHLYYWNQSLNSSGNTGFYVSSSTVLRKYYFTDGISGRINIRIKN